MEGGAFSDFYFLISQVSLAGLGLGISLSRGRTQSPQATLSAFSLLPPTVQLDSEIATIQEGSTPDRNASLLFS